MRLLLLSADLLVTSRVGGIVEPLNISFRSVPSMESLWTTWKQFPAELVVVDLTLAGVDVEAVIEWARSLQSHVEVIAFGPHVHLKKLEQAEHAGCDRVYVRGEFISQMQAILLRTASTLTNDEPHVE
jgi:DNA-binding NtrC family response regulator